MPDLSTTAVFLDLATVDRGDLSLAPLQEALPDWEFHDETKPDATIPHVGKASVVVSNKVALDRHVLENSPALQLVCVAATGTNNIDLEAAGRLGIKVCNARGYATPAVVQHVFMLMLALVTRLPAVQQAVRSGAWERSAQFCLLDFSISELSGRTLGIIGHGELGRAVADVARAFGMQVLVAARPGQPAMPGRTPLPDLLAQADVVSLHCPLVPETRHLIGPRELASMRKSAFLINTARGGIVDEAALAQALRQGTIAGAGIDVLEREPPKVGNPLLELELDNLIVTPHVAWASHESRQRLINTVGDNIRAFLAGNPVNLVAG